MSYGSSPRVRGTRREAARRGTSRRFIPACAGNAARGVAALESSTVHPRVCGERPLAPGKAAPVAGSSPRVRGTLRRGLRLRLRLRVHPRVCGERDANRLHGPRRAGSSPRVRGTPPGRGPSLGRCRFIPACAGNAPQPRSGSRPAPVHPRVCGERGVRPVLVLGHRGSSPRVRGTRRTRGRLNARRRFIPACAGNAPRRGRTCRSAGRFIPACAGNACSSASATAPPPVHPRVCGERLQGLSIPPWRSGSSPRVRGTPTPRPPRGRRGRFIPACAGNARRRRRPPS